MKYDWSDFGTFSVAERAASQGRNPRTGESISISASRTPKFRAGKTLKDASELGVSGRCAAPPGGRIVWPGVGSTAAFSGRLAQSVERHVYTVDVGGSSPSPPTKVVSVAPWFRGPVGSCGGGNFPKRSEFADRRRRAGYARVFQRARLERRFIDNEQMQGHERQCRRTCSGRKFCGAPIAVGQADCLPSQNAGHQRGLLSGAAQHNGGLRASNAIRRRACRRRRRSLPPVGPGRRAGDAAP